MVVRAFLRLAVLTALGLGAFSAAGYAETWDISADFSLNSNPNGAWSYGRTWALDGSFQLMPCRYGVSFWVPCDMWAPSIQCCPLVWAYNNAYGYPVIRWTSPHAGFYDLTCTFTGADSRGVDVFVYVVIDGSVQFSNHIQAYGQSATYSLTGFLLKPGGNVDLVVRWNGGVHMDYSWTRITGRIQESSQSGIGLWADIIGRDQTRVGLETQYWLQYGNAGDQTIDRAAILLSTGSNAQLSRSIPLAWGVSESPGESPSDSLLFLVYALSPGSTATVPFRLKAQAGSTATLDARGWLLPPLYSLPPGAAAELVTSDDYTRSVNSHFRPTREEDLCRTCPDQPYPEGAVVFQHSPSWDMGHEGIMWYDHSQGEPGIPYVWENLGNGTHFTNWADFCNRSYGNGTGWQDSYLPPLNQNEQSALHDWLWSHSYEAELRGQGQRIPFGPLSFCTGAVHRAFKEGLDRDLIPYHLHMFWDFPASDYFMLTHTLWPRWTGTMWSLSTVANDAYYRLIWETGVLLARVPQKLVSIVRSWDPNVKTGVSGCGAERFVAGQQLLQYAVFFENDPDSASAAARVVSIRDTLDIAKMDVQSASIGPIAFGNNILVPPPHAQNWTASVDLPKQIVARVVVNLNPSSGILDWEFTTLDSVTGLPPEDPLVGFLPLNLTPPAGEGYVSVNVVARDGLPTGASVHNRAQITFDANPPLLTPTWSNTIDDAKPVSAVVALDSLQSNLVFDVHWRGSDTGAGVTDYSVLYSEDGRPYTAWLTDTPDTAATFVGKPGTTYSFYSVARDGAHNLEEAPLAADAKTVIPLVSDATLLPSQTRLHRNYPNPFNPSTVIAFDLATRSIVTLRILDVSGRLVRSFASPLALEPGPHSVTWDGRDNHGNMASSGIYLCQLRAGGLRDSNKMVLLR